MRRSILFKFTLSFLVVILLIIVSGLISYSTFMKNDRLEEQLSEAYQLRNFVLQREVDHHLWMTRLYEMFAGGAVPERIESHKDCNLGQWYQSYQPKEYNKKYFEALDAPHELLHQSAQKVVTLFKAGNSDGALQLFRSETIPAVEKVQENLTKMEEAEMSQLEQLETEMELLDASLVKILLITMLACLIVALILAFGLTRNFAVPLKSMTASVERVAEGDLTEKVNVKSNDELGTLADRINTMIVRLHDVVMAIREKSTLVVQTGTQMRSVAEDTGKSSEDVAGSITQIASGNGEIAAKIDELQQISDQLEQSGDKGLTDSLTTVEVAEEAENAAVAGETAVEQAISQLDTVTETVDFASQAIERLGKRSAQIGDMVEMIQGISSQTNLLALNAAIEAARAGKHGEGFAVVADEVRKLAEESSHAAGKITSLIEDIESETTVTVQSMDVNVEQIKRQVDVINEAGSSLQTIVMKAKQTKDKIQGIHQFAKEVKEKSSTMAEAVHSIAAITQQSAASSEEVSASAQQQSASVQQIATFADQLQKMAEQLEEQVKEFKIREVENYEAENR